MWLKTLKNHGNVRRLSKSMMYVVALTALLCAAGCAMAAGEADPTPTAAPDNGGDFGLWDIFDKKEIVASAKSAWADFGPAGGNLLIGVGLLVAMLSILICLLLGAGIMNLGKIGSNNDTHSKGKEMMGTSVLSAVMLVLLLCFIAMLFKGWL